MIKSYTCSLPDYPNVPSQTIELSLSSTEMFARAFLQKLSASSAKRLSSKRVVVTVKDPGSTYKSDHVFKLVKKWDFVPL